MASAIDPDFITTAKVPKAGMRLQLERARDEITALQEMIDTLETQIAICCGGTGGLPLMYVDNATLVVT